MGPWASSMQEKTMRDVRRLVQFIAVALAVTAVVGCILVVDHVRAENRRQYNDHVRFDYNSMVTDCQATQGPATCPTYMP